MTKLEFQLGSKQVLPVLKLFHHTTDGYCSSIELTNVKVIIQETHNSCPSSLEIWMTKSSSYSTSCSRERDDS